MSLKDIYSFFQDDIGIWLSLVVIITSIVQIAPIEINPWSCLFDWFGSHINKSLKKDINKLQDSIQELDTKLESQEQKIDSLNKEVGDNNAINSRYRIIRFADEIMCNMGHSQDHYDQIFVDIDIYEKYCKEHPEFVNNKGQNAISLIQESYSNCVKEHSFLNLR